MYNRRICDARYSKSCVVYLRSSIITEKDMPYLVKQRDSKTETAIPDLTIEENAREWILSSPESSVIQQTKKYCLRYSITMIRRLYIFTDGSNTASQLSDLNTEKVRHRLWRYSGSDTR